MLTILFALQAAAAPAETAQSMFDRASTALTAGKWEEAVAGYSALEARLANSRNRTSIGLARARKGRALNELGRPEAAAVSLRAALVDLAGKAETRSERADAAIVLGRIDRDALDYATARKTFAIALDDAAEGAGRAPALVELARVTMFDDNAAALADIDAAIAAMPPTTEKETLAQLWTIRGRVLLNAQRFADAQDSLKKAIALMGGLTLKSSLTDIVARGDAAIAAIKNGRDDDAVKYLAYTGQGRIAEGPFGRAVSMDPPDCGGEAGLRPEDEAVIEFGIADDGTVSYAQPVYASRAGPVALAFARAVLGWSWNPANMAKVPPFYRVATRVQLRCTKALNAPSITALLAADTSDWLRARGVAPVRQRGVTAPEVAALHADLAARVAAAKGDDITALPVLLRLIASPLVDSEETRALRQRVRTIVAASDPPPVARAYVLAVHGDEPKDTRTRLRGILAQDWAAGDARTADALRLLIAEPRYGKAPAPDAMTLLDAVANDARLPERDPLRVGAWVRLASEQAARKDLPAAQASFARSGLDAQQCALVDANPTMRNPGLSSDDFPSEARRWGFDGWVRTEFDINNAGRTLNQRTIIAYPPFVFSKAAESGIAGTSYTQSYRPNGEMGCAGKTMNITFGSGRRD